MANWDQIVILNAQADTSSTISAVTALELSPDVTYVNMQVNQSGTAGNVILQASLDGTLWHTMCTVATSTTLHAITSVPRYLRSYVTGTADAHVIVTVQYRKP